MVTIANPGLYKQLLNFLSIKCHWIKVLYLSNRLSVIFSQTIIQFINVMINSSCLLSSLAFWHLAVVTFKDYNVINDVIGDIMSLDRYKTATKFNWFGDGWNFIAQFLGVDKWCLLFLCHTTFSGATTNTGTSTIILFSHPFITLVDCSLISLYTFMAHIEHSSSVVEYLLETEGPQDWASPASLCCVLEQDTFILA